MKDVTCAVCMSTDAFPVYRLRRDPYLKRLGLTRQRVRKVMCVTCGLVYSQPRLDDGELTRLYAGLRPTDEPTGEHLLWKRRMARDDFAWVASNLPPTGTVLDVGCSEGSFLREFADRGWTAIGVEPSAYAEYGRRVYGLDVRRMGFDEADLPEASADVVSALRLLEHVSDPEGFLRRVARVLKDGGLLYLEVPTPWRPRHNPKEFLGAQHLFLFTAAPLTTLLARSGFVVLRIDDAGAGLRVLARRSPAAAERAHIPAGITRESIHADARALARRLVIYRIWYFWMVHARREARLALGRGLGERRIAAVLSGGRRWLSVLRPAVTRDVETESSK